MKPKYAVFTLVILFSLLHAESTVAFQHDGPTIAIDAVGESEVIADRIYFSVNITQFDKTARYAFERHKEQEAFLTELLKEEEIEEKHIFANPVNISGTRRQQEGSGYETRQQITIRMDDVTQFESMQLALIENGFVNFSGNFSSSELPEARDEAIANAVEEARRKAGILAEAAGKVLGDVVSIEHSSPQTFPSARMSGLQMAYEADSGSLLQFERTIPVKENVRVVFLIDEE